jgi:hypothetical protein
VSEKLTRAFSLRRAGAVMLPSLLGAILRDLELTMTDLKRPSDQPGATIYITGPSWPRTVNVNDAPMNPWSREHWHLTRQVKILKRDRAEANRLAQAAGHRDALSAPVGNAK